MRSTPDRPLPDVLKRELGLWQLTISGVGIVVGAGIYVLIGQAAATAGSLIWLSFLVAACIAALTGLSYAELAGLFPSAGAEYAFAREAFNEFTGFITGCLMVAGNVVAAAAVSLGFAHYLQHFVAVDLRVGAVGLLAVLTLVITSGMRRSIWLTTGLVVAQVAGLLLVIAVGVPHIGQRSLTDGTPAGVLSAAALVFFAFIGFDEVVTLSDETTEPERVVPRALLLALGISTLLYLGVGVAVVSLVDWHELAASNLPLALAMEHAAGGRAADVVAWIALASTMNTTLLVATAASRLLYDMGRRGSLPAILGHVYTPTGAPVYAALAVLAGTVGFAVTGQFGLIAAVTDVAVYAVFIVVNLAVLRLRATQPNTPRPMRAGPSIGRWPITPVLGLVTTGAMLVFLDRTAWLIGGGVIAAAVVAWLAMRASRSWAAT